ncbi:MULTISPECIES: DUF1573 domain-containing protein [unclassified Bacteroides]|uniref:DUF1573 domain-containing protein n=1 Tax=unclassified Bacteroides TaxID=2646097 RepID=UPI0013ECA38E|nr:MULTISPECIES: DUF1573 domain-containing protein [unclassified Bacteroides]QTO27161.1 DUF1573 domain-containing protein [Bacteroides sp. ZJ-18]
MKVHKLAILFLVLFVTACKQENTKGTDTFTDKWQGKEILFPEKLIFTSLFKDTTLLDFSRARMKVLTYADTVDCMGCKLQLNKWKEFMTTVNSATNDTIPFLFFFYPKDMEEMKYLIQSADFSYPVCTDTGDRLNRLNHFSSDVSFLLDENNHVIVTGNPVLDMDIRNLYLEKITGKKILANSIKTTAEADQSQIDLGTLGKSDLKEVPVIIRNTGNAPLVILDVNTSCGCITVSFDKQPVRPGDETEIKLKVTPAETGFLKKTVRVRANIDKPIIINLQGNITD